jgi:hypothetical protein
MPPIARRNGRRSISRLRDCIICRVPRFRHLAKSCWMRLRPPATNVHSADSILNHTLKAIETEDIDARLKEPEAAADKNKGNRRG